MLWAIVEALVLGWSIPALCVAAYNLYHYVVLFVARPNTALTGWQQSTRRCSWPPVSSGYAASSRSSSIYRGWGGERKDNKDRKEGEHRTIVKDAKRLKSTFNAFE